MLRNKFYIVLVLLLLSCVDLLAQANINRMEYFIDTDPGIGNGIAIPVTVASTVSETFTVSTSALPSGFHTIYFRVQDDNSDWSISESRSFYIGQSNLTAQADVQEVEYFIDTDPGIGLGTKLTVAASTDILHSDIIPSSTLPAGFHTIYFRVSDSDGFWGVSESRSFYVSQSDLQSTADITAVEYYFDVDPGVGLATAIPVTPGTTLNESLTIPTSALSAGHHVLYIRTQDSDGVWSVLESRSFYIDAFGSGRISSIEYFYDTDPGMGSGTNIDLVPPKDAIDSTINLPTSALSNGPHVVGIRLINENGTYSITNFANINLCDGATASILADTVCVGTATSILDVSTNVLGGDIYSWDFDVDGLEDDNTAGDKSFVYATAGNYRAAVSIDRLGCISTDTINVVVVDIPVADAGTDQSLCVTDAILAASPIGADELGTWSVFSGAGTIVSPNSATSIVTGITSTSIELVWSLTNTLGGCSDTDTVMITTNQPITASRLTNTVDISQSVNDDVQSIASINIGDVLTTSISMDPLYGLASVEPSGTITYTPDIDALSLDSLLYRITNQCSNFSENYLVYTVVNDPPTVNVANIPPAQGTVLSVDLAALITDPNNNTDISSITIVSQPISGAVASIDNGMLTIDYAGVTFSGDDTFEIQVCDLLGACVTQSITIPGVEVGGEDPPITVFNGVSPDGDGYNDFLEIENIEFYPDNTVIIVNRWGGEIQRLQGYNNQTVVFNDSSLPSGTYYYHILTGIKDTEPITGHFILKTDN